MDIIYREESYKIIGACFEVYKEKGCGFLEPVYQECMEIELGLQGIPFRAQAALKLEYKGHPLKHGYQPDFICYDKIIVELKAVTELTDEHRAQVHNYLSAAQPMRVRLRAGPLGRGVHSSYCGLVGVRKRHAGRD